MGFMKIQFSGIVLMVGNYGSGKTEVAVNLAAAGSGDGSTVCIVDLDVVNPYFRTREARQALEDLGVEVVLPPEPLLKVDLPVVSPRIRGALQKPRDLTLLDVGGDDAGATVLASLTDVLQTVPHRVLQVVNPNRPYTATVAGCTRIRREIEAAGRVTIDGLIGNANLIEETVCETISEGYALMCDLVRETGLPLEFITAPAELLPQLDVSEFACPVLPIHRQMVPPWRRPGRLSAVGR